MGRASGVDESESSGAKGGLDLSDRTVWDSMDEMDSDRTWVLEHDENEYDKESSSKVGD